VLRVHTLIKYCETPLQLCHQVYIFAERVVGPIWSTLLYDAVAHTCIKTDFSTFLRDYVNIILAYGM